MTCTVVEHTDPGALWAAAGTVLLGHEACNSVMVGVLSRLRAAPPEQRGDPLLLAVEEGGRVVAAAVRTPPRSLLLSAGAPPAALDALVAHLDAPGREIPGVNGTVADAGAFAERWVARRGGAARTVMHLRLFACTELAVSGPVPGRLRDVTRDDRELLVAWIDAFSAEALPHEAAGQATGEAVDRMLEERPPPFVVWDDGRPVSMAGYVVPDAGSPRIGAVYTPSDVRGLGYASACVGALTQRLLASGHERVLLFTDLANPTSNRIYTRMGYRPLGDFAELELGTRRPQ